MFLKRKKRKQVQGHDHAHVGVETIDTQEFRRPIDTVKRTLDSLGIESPMTIVGSTALYLHGLRDHRPIDTDVVVPAHVLASIQRSGMLTPSGLQARHEEHYGNAGNATTFLVTIPRENDQDIHVDLISRFQTTSENPTPKELDSEMQAYDEDFDSIVPYVDMNGVRVATVEYIYRELSRRKDSKAKMHRGALESALWGMGINPKSLRRK